MLWCGGARAIDTQLKLCARRDPSRHERKGVIGQRHTVAAELKRCGTQSRRCCHARLQATDTVTWSGCERERLSKHALQHQRRRHGHMSNSRRQHACECKAQRTLSRHRVRQERATAVAQCDAAKRDDLLCSVQTSYCLHHLLQHRHRVAGGCTDGELRPKRSFKARW